MSKSLDEILGGRVIQAIMKTGRYSHEDLEKYIIKKFAKGSLKEEDWKLFVELEILKEENNEQKS